MNQKFIYILNGNSFSEIIVLMQKIYESKFLYWLTQSIFVRAIEAYWQNMQLIPKPNII